MSGLTVKSIHDFLARFAPPALAEDWDSIGLQVGSMKSPVRGVLVSLDATEAAMDEALERRANLLITHHPLLLKPLKALDDRSLPARLARWAVQMDLNILTYHTNLDSTRSGLNDLLAKKLGLRTTRPLLPSRSPKMKSSGLGRIGNVRPVSLEKCAAAIAGRLGLKNLRYTGDPRHRVRKLAVMTGSGGGFFGEAKQAGADALVTGDVKYHHALDALAEGIAIIDIGHFAGEIGMVGLVAGLLRRWPLLAKAGLRVHESRSGADPFHFWNKK